MRELDKNKVYDLSELTIGELNDIKKFMCRNYGWKEKYLVDFDSTYCIYFKEKWFRSRAELKNMISAKELFYTLENIQVDCRELSEEQIKEMADVFKKAGYKYYNKNKKRALQKSIDYYFIYLDDENEIIVHLIDDNKTTITYDKFIELFGRKEEETEWIIENNNKQAYKENSNKLNYELDFNFITQLAERMAQNKHKYEPYNWQKLDNIDELKQALFRHVLEVMKGNYEDDNRLFGHLESIALNCLFINYQLNNLKTK